MSQRLLAQLGLLASAIVFAVSLGILVAQNINTTQSSGITATDTAHHTPAMPLSAAAVDQR